jgi:hypothetical protein
MHIGWRIGGRVPVKRLKKVAAAHLALVGAAEVSEVDVSIKKVEKSKGSMGMRFMCLFVANSSQGR